MRYFVTLNDRAFSLRVERERDQLRFWSAPPGGAQNLSSAPASGAPNSLSAPASGAEWPLECELLSPARHGRPALVRVQGRVIRVQLDATTGARRSARVDGEALRVALETELERRARPAPSAAKSTGTRILAPMPGRIVKVNVRAGDRVATGTPLLSVEAMKMENELQSPGAGKVVSVRVEVGATVESDQELIVITPE